jgi:hypothetical protein
LVSAYSTATGEAVRIEAWLEKYGIAGWLAVGSLVGFERYNLPARVERFDPRSGKTSHFTTLTPNDPNGIQSLRRVKVTPDGRAMAFDEYRAIGTLNLLEWKPAR